MHYLLATILLFSGFILPASAHEDAPAQGADSAAMFMLRMHSTAHALESVSDRIDTRATILAQSGVDTTNARPLIEAARTSLSTAGTLIENGTYGEMQSIIGNLLSAHQNLLDALEALKAADASVTSAEILGAPEVQ
jgi:hypothetical protein